MLGKLERKFGKFAIHNLILYLLICYGIGYLLLFMGNLTNVYIIGLLQLEPHFIIHGLQLWRLITWVLIPPNDNILLVIIMFFLYYQLGTTLEHTWGAFRFNLYIFGGMLFTIIGAFITYAIYGPTVSIGATISTYYINMSIFLAFATCFPDMQILLYFIIPVKMKWMSILYLAIIGYTIVQYSAARAFYLSIPIIASLLNFVVFYFATRPKFKFNPKQMHRRAEFKRAVNIPQTRMSYRDGTPMAKHKCVVCGRTEITNPELDFRFCSKCDGNYEYCSEHLFTHRHIKH